MDYLIRECTEDDLPSLIALCGKHAEYERTAYHPEGKQDLLKKALFSSEPEYRGFGIGEKIMAVGVIGVCW
jgi:hypothetical protein